MYGEIVIADDDGHAGGRDGLALAELLRGTRHDARLARTTSSGAPRSISCTLSSPNAGRTC